MKFASFSIVMVLGFGALAHATSLAPDYVYRSTFTHMTIDENSPLPQAADTGYVDVKVDRGTVELMIMPKKLACPPGRYCKAVMPAPHYEELPIISDVVNRCGARVITAREDARPIDGPLRQIQIVDNKDNSCISRGRLAPVAVHFNHELSGFGGLHQKSVDLFIGRELVRIQ